MSMTGRDGLLEDMAKLEIIQTRIGYNSGDGGISCGSCDVLFINSAFEAS